MRLRSALGCGPLLLVLTAGCPKERERPRPTVVQPAKPKAAASTASESAAAPQASSPALNLALSVEESPDGVGLHVINRGPDVAHLHADVSLEIEDKGRDHVLRGDALTLRASCATQGCVKLAPFGELVAPSHLGQIEGERCDRLLVPPEPGSYRLRVASCDRTRSAAVEFTWRRE